MTSEPAIAAREAFCRRDWRSARDGFAERPALGTEDLEMLAESHWWLGEGPESTAVSEILYGRLLADGSMVRAADRALRVAMMWALRGDITVAMAWAKRAETILASQPTSAVHGYALYFAASVDLDFTGVGDGEAAAAELSQLAAAVCDPTLEVFAQTLRGIAAVLHGDLGGFDALDQAMLPVVGGQVEPLWAGDIYCSVIHVCESIGDLARMRAWTDALARWARPLSDTFVFGAVTRLHQLQLLRAEGEWDAVEDELEALSEGLVGAHAWLAGTGFHELGELNRLRGRTEAAHECYDRARSLGIDPEPGQAALLQTEGRTEEALAALRVALAGETPLRRAPILCAAVEIALGAGEVEWARQCADELDVTATHFGSPGLLASADTARARILLADDRPADAVPLLDHAARVYRTQRHQHASAIVHELLSVAQHALGQHPAAAASFATATAIHARLGATAELARLLRPRPAGLTAREVEVLAQVSTGLTNKQVALALVISEKTVSRHLASIFTKVGVTSRTAAAAWARQHRLV